MAVTVFVSATGEKFTGKFASIEGERVRLFSEARVDKQGRMQGLGKETEFAVAEVEVLAHRRDQEVREARAPIHRPSQ